MASFFMVELNLFPERLVPERLKKYPNSALFTTNRKQICEFGVLVGDLDSSCLARDP
jgi:hypothetical protein